MINSESKRACYVHGLNSKVICRIKLSNRVHYPYARTNGASRCRVVGRVGRVASRHVTSCGVASTDLILHCNLNSPNLLVTYFISSINYDSPIQKG